MDPQGRGGLPPHPHSSHQPFLGRKKKGSGAAKSRALSSGIRAGFEADVGHISGPWENWGFVENSLLQQVSQGAFASKWKITV